MEITLRIGERLKCDGCQKYLKVGDKVNVLRMKGMHTVYCSECDADTPKESMKDLIINRIRIQIGNNTVYNDIYNLFKALQKVKLTTDNQIEKSQYQIELDKLTDRDFITLRRILENCTYPIEVIKFYDTQFSCNNDRRE